MTFHRNTRAISRGRGGEEYNNSETMYNCSSWATNLTTNKSLDCFHRKQLRICLNIRYPKIINNQDLYTRTKQIPISESVKQRRLAHLGHILRRKTPTRDILQRITKVPPGKGGSKGATILKTYKSDLGNTEFSSWFTQATTRRL